LYRFFYYLFMIKGRVIQSTGSWYLVNTTDKIYECRLPGRFRLNIKNVTNPIAVGDWVDISLNEDDTGTIEKIHERKNFVLRKATHGKRGKHILASNIDQILVVQSVRKPKFKETFTDRILVTAEAYEIPAGIIINKMDLAKEKDQVRVSKIRNLYTSLGYTLLPTSIHQNDSLEALRKLLHQKISVFIGPSGVGKTSLINAIEPEINLKTKEISSYSNKGKHTTTYAQLVPLSFDGYLVDTPGIREFGVVDIKDWELSLYFPEMLEARKECKFNTCTHHHEPACGVIKAVEKGLITTKRYKSYLQILESVQQDQA